MRICEFCSDQFQPRSLGRPPRFCSEKCRTDWHHRRPDRVAERARWAATTLERNRKEQVELTCGYCSAVYTRPGAKAETSTSCSGIECQRAHNARMQRERGYTKRSRAKLGRPASTDEAAKRRRVRLAGNPVEVFTRTEIFERDAWTCGICLEPVDPALRWPDPLSVSIDHVVPVAHGGAHTRENVRCAHVGCNARRGADRAGSSPETPSPAIQSAT